MHYDKYPEIPPCALPSRIYSVGREIVGWLCIASFAVGVVAGHLWVSL